MSPPGSARRSTASSMPDIAGALMGINAVKGVEIGDGFATAAMTGEENADEMRMGNDGRPRFLSNHAGGILGGISTGQAIVARFAVKPTSSILTPRKTVDRYGNETEIITKGRHDPASASARCRSAKRWWRASSPITICVTGARSARARAGHGRSETTNDRHPDSASPQPSKPSSAARSSSSPTMTTARTRAT